MGTPRLLIVSNRLPLTVRLDGTSVHLRRAEGGLASGLRDWHRHGDSVWIGWPGDVGRLGADQLTRLDELLARRRIVPVYLSREQIDRYYHEFSNSVLWPLLHYQIDRVPVDTHGWAAYRDVNARFADQVVQAWRPGDRIWVHDYQLMLLPAMLRERLPDARIGFFLHVPFPSSEVFRILPWRRELLQGLLGADLIGFHTFAYLRHFMASLLHVDGVEANVASVRVGNRDVSLGVFPMGVDAQSFAARAADESVTAAVAAIRADAGGRRILLGVDRLDYTKGIPRRLAALERLFAEEPAWRDDLRYVQVAVPSRGEATSYQTFRRQVEEAVGRINGTCATLRSTPIHYLHRSVSTAELVALYRAADVMLVTPLRDGMNLVAKEFVASRIDEDGVLLLSEFAGAAAELGDAIVVNPYDVDAMVAAMRRALAMPAEERRQRMRGLRRRVAAYDVRSWAGNFLGQLTPPPPISPDVDHSALRADLARAMQAPRIHLLLGYDGTLVPIAETPEQAIPDAELLALLEALAAHHRLDVHIVSGRPREWLEHWFGDLPITLWAEHALWQRCPGTGWEACTLVTSAWRRGVDDILEQFAASTPGARIERKTASVAWHYRQADSEFGARQAHELRMLLGDALSNQPLEVLEGKKVIEIRLRGVSKALVAHHTKFPDHHAVIAVGDDRNDEDLFHALPPDAVTVAVGDAPTRAAHHVADHHSVRRILLDILAAPDATLDEIVVGSPARVE